MSKGTIQFFMKEYDKAHETCTQVASIYVPSRISDLFSEKIVVFIPISDLVFWCVMWHSSDVFSADCSQAWNGSCAGKKQCKTLRYKLYLQIQSCSRSVSPPSNLEPWPLYPSPVNWKFLNLGIVIIPTPWGNSIFWAPLSNLVLVVIMSKVSNHQFLNYVTSYQVYTNSDDPLDFHVLQVDHSGTYMFNKGYGRMCKVLTDSQENPTWGSSRTHERIPLCNAKNSKVGECWNCSFQLH